MKVVGDRALRWSAEDGWAYVLGIVEHDDGTAEEVEAVPTDEAHVLMFIGSLTSHIRKMELLLSWVANDPADRRNLGYLMHPPKNLKHAQSVVRAMLTEFAKEDE